MEKTASATDLVIILRKHVDFKKAIIQFTEQEIKSLEREINFLKEKEMEPLPEGEE